MGPTRGDGRLRRTRVHGRPLWMQLVQRVPSGSMPTERRIALDILDLRECIEQWGDSVRWVPSGAMLVDALTKKMPPDVLRQVMTDNRYSFRWSEAAVTAKTRGKEARRHTTSWIV